MRTLSILLLALFATFSVVYTLNAENQEESKKQEEDDGDDMKALMKELMKGVVAQVQEEEDQKTSAAELESTLDGLMSQIQDDDDQDSDALSQEDNGSDDDLSALLQGEEEEGDDGAQEQEDNDNDEDLLTFLQGDDELAEVQDDDDGGDATSQGSWFSAIRRASNYAVRICRKVNRYSRFVKCLPRMQAEMQKADDGDEDLAKDMLKRIANLQEEGGDGDAEAEFFGRLLKKPSRFVRRFLSRRKKIYRKIRRRYSRIRQRFGSMIRGYRRIRNCVRRLG
jgi:hypothetical protein